MTILPLWGLLWIGCSGDEVYPVFEVVCPAFGNGETIPSRHTCDGANISPPLSFFGAPEETVEFAVVAEDPDVILNPPYTHWLIWGIDGFTGFVAADQNKRPTPGLRQGTAGSGEVGYEGMCPPAGETHRYVFKVYALDEKMELKEGATRRQVKSAMKGHIVGKGELEGYYR